MSGFMLYHYNILSFSVRQQIHFSRGFPGQASEVGALWCYPGSYPMSGFIFPIWYNSLLSIFPLVFKMKHYQSYKMSVSKF